MGNAPARLGVPHVGLLTESERSLQPLYGGHMDHLMEQVIAYRDERYEEAYLIGRHGYCQTSELAAGLSGAIADQFPLLYPDTALLGAGGRACPPSPQPAEASSVRSRSCISQA